MSDYAGYITQRGRYMKLNLGCGMEPNLEEGWVNVDILKLDKVDVVHDLNIYPYPFDNSVADEIKAIDIIEHLDKPKDFIEEVHRILQVGGKLFLTTPHWQSKNCWIDLTHRRGFDECSFDYFDDSKQFGKDYNYYSKCKFSVATNRTENDNLEITMVKV